MERWKTAKLALEGGLIENEDLLKQSEERPGSAVQLINYEPGLRGGYRRITGFTKFDPNAVTGSGPVTGVFVFDTGAVACRGTSIYKSSGAGWTQISSDTRNGVVKYRAAQYNFSTPTLMLVDGTNKPARYEPAGDGYSVVTDAPAGATCIAEFRQHIFLGVGTSLFFSQPTDDVGFDATLGAGEINIGQIIVNLFPFRDELYVFCKDQIYKITGTNLLNFELVPVTKNIGCSAADSIQEIGGTVVFLGPDGVRPIAATDRNNDIEIASISRAIQSRVTSLTENYGAGSICSVVVREKSQYRLFGNDAGTNDVDAFGILGGIRRMPSGETNYEWSEIRGFKPYCADSAYIGNIEYVLHGGYDGYVYRQESGYGCDDEDMVSVFQTPDLTFGDPTIRKTLYKLDTYIDFENSQVGDISLNVLFDYSGASVLQPATINLLGVDAGYYYDDNAYYDDGTTRYSDVAATVVKKNLIGSGYTASFKFSTEDSNPPHTIRSFVVQYNIGGRR